MDYRFVHFAILSCIFLIVGSVLFRSYKKSREPHQEHMTVGTISGYKTADKGYREMYVDIQIGGQTIRNYPFLLKTWPRTAARGTELQIGYYMDEKGRPECTIRSEGYVPVSAPSPVLAISTLGIGAVCFVLTLVFLIKNFIK